MADLRSDEFMNHALRDWEDMVYRLALSQTREPADASDVCQETFISLLKDATVFQDDEHLKAWLIRVTINRSNQLRRTASRHRTQPLPDDETLLPKTPPASAALMANEVWRVLDTLPPKYRGASALCGRVFDRGDRRDREVSALDGAKPLASCPRPAQDVDRTGGIS